MLGGGEVNYIYIYIFFKCELYLSSSTLKNA